MSNLSIQVPIPSEDVMATVRRRAGHYDVSGNYDTLNISKPIWYRNDLAPLLFLKFEDRGNETVIHAQLRMATWVRIFGFIWVGFVCLITVLTLSTVISDYRSGEGPIEDLKFVLFPIAMIGGYFLLWWFCRWIARGNSEELLDWFIGLFPNAVFIRSGTHYEK